MYLWCFLGYHISKEGAKLLSDKVNAISDYSHQETEIILNTSCKSGRKL